MSPDPEGYKDHTERAFNGVLLHLGFDTGDYTRRLGTGRLQHCESHQGIYVHSHEYQLFVDGSIRVINEIISGGYQSLVFVGASSRPFIWLFKGLWDLHLPEVEKPKVDIISIGSLTDSYRDPTSIKEWAAGSPIVDGESILVIQAASGTPDPLDHHPVETSLTTKAALDYAYPKSQVDITHILHEPPRYRVGDQIIITGLVDPIRDAMHFFWRTWQPSGYQYNEIAETELVLRALGFTQGMRPIPVASIYRGLKDNFEYTRQQLVHMDYPHPKDAVLRMYQRVKNAIPGSEQMKRAMGTLASSSGGSVRREESQYAAGQSDFQSGLIAAAKRKGILLS